MPLLEFAMATFWVQIHNVPERSLTQTMGELVRRSTGKVIQVVDLKDDVLVGNS